MTHELYSEDYFERGVEKKLSGYTEYHWRPEYVLPLANWLKQRFNKKEEIYGINARIANVTTYLDYGCAKGFLVKALKLLGCDARGFDISEYAITHCEPEVKDFVDYKKYNNADIIIAKDVLEHIHSSNIPILLAELNEMSKEYLVAIIPLGDQGKFRIREYEMDITHVTKEDEVWWINQFNQAGFEVEEFYYSLPGIKENWTKQYPYGNGIFILRKN